MKLYSFLSTFTVKTVINESWSVISPRMETQFCFNMLLNFSLPFSGIKQALQIAPMSELDWEYDNLAVLGKLPSKPLIQGCMVGCIIQWPTNKVENREFAWQKEF